MTQDFIDEFSDALVKEKRGFVILVHNGRDYGKGSVHIRTNLDDWPLPPNARSKEHDTILALTAAFTEDGVNLSVLSEPERQACLGAMDTLGTLLAKYGHQWSEGERAVYDQAVEILKA